MDTSVNMKMTPEEHRLIRDCVMESKAEADRIVNERTVPLGDATRAASTAEIRVARERSLRTNDLLEKL